MWPDLRLPADSLLPGQTPTHEAKRSALPKSSISAPISTSSIAAPIWSMPGIVCISASVSRSDSSPSSNRASKRLILASISFNMPHQFIQHEAVAGAQFALQGVQISSRLAFSRRLASLITCCGARVRR